MVTEAPVEARPMVSRKPATLRVEDELGSPITQPFRSAIRDFADSLRRWKVAAWLGWKDAVLPFRRSFIGPFWLVIQTVVWLTMIAFLLGPSLGQGVATYVPYVAAGMIFFHYFSGLLVDGAASFTRNAGLIKNIPNPLFLYLLRVLFKSTFLLSIQLPVLVGVNLLTGHQLQFVALWAIPGVLLASWSILGASLALASITPRLRDIPFALQAVMRVMFFATPVFWTMDGKGLRSLAALFNPFAHLLNIVREPLLGRPMPMDSVYICIVGGSIAWLVGVLLFSKIRPYIAVQL